MNRREFLESKGFTVGRGRPSRAVLDAIAEFKAGGGSFDDDAKHAFKEKGNKHALSANPKDVRAWAKKKGIKVAERGRMDGSVVAQYCAENPSEAKDRPAITVNLGKDLRQAAPRTSAIGAQWKVQGSGKAYDERQVCTRCRVSLGWHTCNTPSIVTVRGIEAVYLA